MPEILKGVLLILIDRVSEQFGQFVCKLLYFCKVKIVLEVRFKSGDWNEGQ